MHGIKLFLFIFKGSKQLTCKLLYSQVLERAKSYLFDNCSEKSYTYMYTCRPDFQVIKQYSYISCLMYEHAVFYNYVKKRNSFSLTQFGFPKAQIKGHVGGCGYAAVLLINQIGQHKRYRYSGCHSHSMEAFQQFNFSYQYFDRVPYCNLSLQLASYKLKLWHSIKILN